MLMELFQRLFGATRDAIALPHFDAGNRAVEISAAILRECIDLGSAWPDGPNRERLTAAPVCSRPRVSSPRYSRASATPPTGSGSRRWPRHWRTVVHGRTPHTGRLRPTSRSITDGLTAN